jgi:putative dimethyl sulfoxide reductase chaperone
MVRPALLRQPAPRPAADGPAALELRAEFYLCMARAFLPPDSDAVYRAFREDLADDLAELGRDIGYDIAAPLAALRRELAAVPDAVHLLRTYSRLFLTPPVPVTLNAGVYLDGAILGPSVVALEECYRKCGLQRAERFRDLSDHVSVQMEFAALLFGLEARAARGETPPPMRAAHFLEAFASYWLPYLCETLEKATDEGISPNPWLPLARILATAVLADAVPMPGKPAVPERLAPPPLDDAAMDEIVRALQAKGRPTAYLATPAQPGD